jgi:hypothetical protein
MPMTTRQANAAIRSGQPVMVVETICGDCTPFLLAVLSQTATSVRGEYIGDDGGPIVCYFEKKDLTVVRRRASAYDYR